MSESEIGRMQDMIDNSTNNREVSLATKRKEKLLKQLKECREYNEKNRTSSLLRIELDLDDGVKVNYRKVQTALDGSYLDPGNIQVALFDDRLEVTSPGMLLNNVTISKMMEGYSKPRNPAIARAFAYMKIIEKWGTGIPRLFEACEEYGLPKPELVDFDGDFRVNMYRKIESEFGVNGVTTQATQDTTQATQNTTQTELSEDDKSVLMSIVEDPRITQKEMAAKLDWKIDRVKYYLNKLKRNGIIKRVGTSQKGHWEVVSEGIGSVGLTKGENLS